MGQTARVANPQRGGGIGYASGHGPQIAPGEPAAERDSFGEVVRVGRWRAAIWGLNWAIPEKARAVIKRDLTAQLMRRINP